MVPHQKIKSQYNIKSLNMQRSHLHFFPPFFFVCIYTLYEWRWRKEQVISGGWGLMMIKGQVIWGGEGKGELILQLHEIYIILCVRFSLNTEKEKVVDLNSHGIHESLCCLSVCVSSMDLDMPCNYHGGCMCSHCEIVLHQECWNIFLFESILLVPMSIFFSFLCACRTNPSKYIVIVIFFLFSYIHFVYQIIVPFFTKINLDLPWFIPTVLPLELSFKDIRCDLLQCFENRIGSVSLTGWIVNWL